MLGNLMRSRNFFVACVLALAFLGFAPATNVASAGQAVVKSDKSARNYVLRNKQRVLGPRIHLPIGPSYIYYDYPYYYSRGYYPTHIVGYVYYHPYYYHRSHYRYPPQSRRQRVRRN